MLGDEWGVRGETRARQVKDAPPSAILRATSHAPEKISARERDQPTPSRPPLDSTALISSSAGSSSPPAATRYRDSCAESAFQLGNLAHARSANREMVSPSTMLTSAKEPAPASAMRTKDAIWSK
jgi:hypothetical protein